MDRTFTPLGIFVGPTFNHAFYSNKNLCFYETQNYKKSSILEYYPSVL